MYTTYQIGYEVDTHTDEKERDGSNRQEVISTFEQAEILRRLIAEDGLTIEDAARRLSLTEREASRSLRLLHFSPEEREIIKSRGLSLGHCHALLLIAEERLRIDTMRVIISESLTEEQSEAYILHRLKEMGVILDLSPAPAPSSPNTKGPVSTAHAVPATKRTIHRTIKDIRLFYNCIDRALNILREAGVDVVSARRERDGEICIAISISNKKASAAPSST